MAIARTGKVITGSAGSYNGKRETRSSRARTILGYRDETRRTRTIGLGECSRTSGRLLCREHFRQGRPNPHYEAAELDRKHSNGLETRTGETMPIEVNLQKRNLNQYTRGKVIIPEVLGFGGGFPLFHWFPHFVSWGRYLSMFWLGTELWWKQRQK